MKIYNYHDTTGESRGTSNARENPLEKGKFLIPRNATLSVPLPVGVNEAVIFKSGAWEIVPDFRGVIYWMPDGSRHEIIELNEIEPAQATHTPPTPATNQELFDNRLLHDPLLKAIIDELEVQNPGFIDKVRPLRS